MTDKELGGLIQAVLEVRMKYYQFLTDKIVFRESYLCGDGQTLVKKS